MITAQKFRGRRTATVAAFALLAAGMTGCSAVNQQATSLHYAASDGIVFDVASIEARNLMLVTNSADEKARFIGSLINDTDQAASVELTVDGNSTTVEVPKKSSVELEDDANKTVVPSAGVEPGSHADLTVKVGSSSAAESLPVVNGVLPEYRPYLPDGYNSDTVKHLEPTAPILKPEGH